MTTTQAAITTVIQKRPDSGWCCTHTRRARDFSGLRYRSSGALRRASYSTSTIKPAMVVDTICFPDGTYRSTGSGRNDSGLLNRNCDLRRRWRRFRWCFPPLAWFCSSRGKKGGAWAESTDRWSSS
jgi:hypothetical protein